MAVDGASVDDDGRLRLTVESIEGAIPQPPNGVEIEPAGVAFEGDGRATVTLTASATVEDGGSMVAAAPDGGQRATEAEDGATGHADDGAGRDVDQSGRTPVTEAGDGGEDRQQDGATDGGSPSDGAENGAAGNRGHVTVGAREDRGVPPFDDTELLEEVYDSCDTFAEMTDALGMDVTAETVRRYMIDHGIHEPDSYETVDEDDGEEPAETDSDPASPVVLADGIGLPEDVTVDGLVDVVERSNTIYEVETELGIDRDVAVEMLQQLDLVGYVTGRLAMADEREVSRALVVDRLQQHAEAS